MRRLIALSFLASMAASLVAAQGIPPYAAILPASFAGWTAKSRGPIPPPVIYNGDHAASVLAERQAAAQQEYGLAAGERAEYVRGSETLEATLYKMKDPSGAYGEYSYLRGPDMGRASFTDHSSMSRTQALVLAGNLVLDVRGTDVPKNEPDLKGLVSAILSYADHGPLPTLWQKMPPDGMVERTDRYILGPNVLGQFIPMYPGDWLGFANGAEAELAQYRIGDRRVYLVVADFPTPQAASDKLKDLQQTYNTNGSHPDSQLPPLFAKRSLTLLAVVSGAQNQNDASKLLDLVHSQTELTWNEPGFSFTEPGIGTMIVGAIIGTGIICAFALISGIAFGGVRLVVKRLLPDKVFDRSSHLQVLQLGLSSKPINAEDFYGLGKGSSE
jgi:hypothetical protein